MRLVRTVGVSALVVGGSIVSVCAEARADHTAFAANMVSYSAGSTPAPGYTNPLVALGSPQRMTGAEFNFPGAVTPFNPPFGTDEIVSIGAGGHLTLEFARPIVDDPHNPFGIDFLIFGNAGYIDAAFPSGTVRPDALMFGLGAASLVQVSNDLADWRTIGGGADGPFPTLGYLDLADPYSTTPGFVPSDFTRPVDPAFDSRGRTFAELVAGYNGSGGGTGFDLAGTGLASARYVRILNVATSGSVEIDAVSIVTPIPAPSSLLFLAGTLLLGARRRGR